ncbi:HNH endonuclease [Sutcliffiella horikoshii]|uniref:Putative HNH nuclease YajD n=1 Tax=Sutcliffiella horikoshii TaxID=79883 RepID=A0A5D4SZ04_9BACI|nr:HNH endonuclease signature motif containing protein [Sutcliffiella horikoshii]TYS67046.1 HNH endonuclease [Sutcliffiella horikoshii]
MPEYQSKLQKRKFYDSKAWKLIRETIKKRDNYECQECKRQGKVFLDTNEYSEKAKRKKIQLVVDHIEELEDRPDLALDEENLQTLCVNCHNKKHGRYFRKFVWKENKWAQDERW